MGDAPEPEANRPNAPPAQQTADQPADLPPGLRQLSRLVTLLVVTMIGGFLIIVALFVIRLGGPPDQPPGPGAETALPAAITLPEGARPEAVTLARNWVLVLTEGGQVLLYDRATGALRHEIALQE